MTKENEFEWIKDIPVYIDLESRAAYYFEPNLTCDEVEEFVSRVNPKYHKSRIYEWLNRIPCGELGLKYFAISDNMELDGWCDMTTVKMAKDWHHPNHKYIDGRTL